MSLVEITGEEYQNACLKLLRREERRIPVRGDKVAYYENLILLTEGYFKSGVPVKYYYDTVDQVASFQIVH